MQQAKLNSTLVRRTGNPEKFLRNRLDIWAAQNGCVLPAEPVLRAVCLEATAPKKQQTLKRMELAMEEGRCVARSRPSEPKV